MKEFLDKEDYVLINATDKVKNGPFTRSYVQHPDDKSKKSVHDLVIMSKDLVQFVDELVIDEERKMTPYRNSKGILKYPDHYAILVKIVNIPRKKDPEKMAAKKVVTWNLAKVNEWES